MIVYKTTNAINGKFYVGQDSKNDPSYLGSGVLLKKAIEKYGKENFVKEILEVCNTKQQLNEREIFWIEETRAREVGYNIAEGGHGGSTYTEETRQRISEEFKGKYVSQDTVQKRRATRQRVLEANPDAYKHSEETKRKIGEKSKGRSNSEYNRMMSSIKNSGENNPNYGKSIPWSEERKQAARGRLLSEETKRKMSESHKKNPVKYWEGKERPQASIEKYKSTMASKTPEERLERYVNWYYGKFRQFPSEDKKQEKLNSYKMESDKC